VNKLTGFLKGFAIDYVIKYMKENKSLLIKKANEKLNVPILNEAQEAELLEACFDISMDMVEGIKDK
jgi:hypothetical protein|tara:strand:+ start:632 stop:832 length:201 start_codon:yes stop_codon:yes gene_type:complete